MLKMTTLNAVLFGLLSARLHAVEITVDPAKPLKDATNLILSQDSPEEPELDLGYNDHLEFTLTLPKGGAGDVRIGFVCKDAPAVTAQQSVIVPGSLVLRDGKPHCYRIDMGAEPWWRGRLKQLQIEPVALQVSAIRCGDGEDQDYDTTPMDADWKGMKSAESKHFRIFWGRDLSKDFTTAQAHGTLRNFEEAWQVIVKVLKMKKVRPLEGQPGHLTKTNICTHAGGYQSGGGTVGMDPSGLRVDPPSWVIPHELMHAFQEVQGGKMPGMWWENHADYAIECYLQHFRPLFEGTEDVRDGPPTCFNPAFMTMAHWYLAHGRDYYLCWPIWTYLDENPDAIPGLGNCVSSRLWQSIGEHEDLFSCIKRIVPGVDLKSLIGAYARRNVSWSYGNGEAMRRVTNAHLNNEPQERARIYTDLIRRPDAPDWWLVPQHKAPQAGGYTQHELSPPKNGEVSVELRGLSIAKDQDWRASLVALHKDGSEAGHAGPFGPGVQSFHIPPDAVRLVLVVAATPASFVDWEQDEMKYPIRTHESRRRYHYEVRLVGASPLNALPVKPSDVEGRSHTDGGGFVANTAKVAETAYVGPRARVLGEAQVQDNARITDEAVVQDKALIKDNAVIRDHARVTGESMVSGTVRVLHEALLKDKAQARDLAVIEGCSEVWSDDGNDAYVGGDAVLTADYGGARKVTNGFQSGFVGWVACPEDWIAARTAPANRWVSYEFAAPHHDIIRDVPGMTDAYAIGRPGWQAKDASRSGFITFDGKAQALLLDRSVADLFEATISVWVKWSGGPAMQPVFHFGNGTDAVFFTPDDGKGHAALIARKDGKTYTVEAQSALPKDRWVHLAVALDGKEAAIFGNAKLAAKGPCPFRLQDFRASDDQPAHCYLARGQSLSQPWFQGAMDDFRVWSVVLSESKLKNDSEAEPGLVARFLERPRELKTAADVITTKINDLREGSLCAWIKPKGEQGEAGCVIDSDLPGEFGTGLAVKNGRVRVILDDEFWDTNVLVTPERWQHVALVYTATEARLHLNGALAATHAYKQGPISKQSYVIGTSAAAPDQRFSGQLHDVRLYDRTLTTEAIKLIISQSNSHQ